MPEMKDHEEEYARVLDEYRESLPRMLNQLANDNDPVLSSTSINTIRHSAHEIERLRAELAVVFGECEKLRNELDKSQSSEHEGWRYADELEQERKRLTAELADLQSHFDSTALHDGIVIAGLRAELARLVERGNKTEAAWNELRGDHNVAVNENARLRAELAYWSSKP